MVQQRLDWPSIRRDGIFFWLRSLGDPVQESYQGCDVMATGKP
jgi:hypothetical protein